MSDVFGTIRAEREAVAAAARQELVAIIQRIAAKTDGEADAKRLAVLTANDAPPLDLAERAVQAIHRARELRPIAGELAARRDAAEAAARALAEFQADTARLLAGVKAEMTSKGGRLSVADATRFGEQAEAIPRQRRGPAAELDAEVARAAKMLRDAEAATAELAGLENAFGEFLAEPEPTAEPKRRSKAAAVK